MVKSLKTPNTDLSSSSTLQPKDVKLPEDVRQELLAELLKETVGPRWGEEEELDERPQSLYLTGMLYPQKYEMDPDEKESHESPEEESEKLKGNFTTRQSSIGITCVVSNQKQSISAKIKYATYFTQGERKSQTYKRQKHEETILIDFSGDKKSNTESFTLKDTPWLTVDVSYELETTGEIFLHVYLVNETITNKLSVKNIAFQASIELFSDEAIILNKKFQSNTNDSNEELLDFLFSDMKNFGYGHGCAVTWNATEVEGEKIDKISTTFVPIEPQNKIIPTITNDNLKNSLSMKELYSVSDENFEKYKELLSPIVNEYDSWIEENLEKNLERYDGKEYEILQQQIREAKEASSRIKNGINLVSTQKNVAKAFRFTNRVMALQQYRSEQIKKYSAEGKEFSLPNNEDDINSQWRLFQIAFILMNLESIVNPTIENRNVADLLWFPTGGGKTEAYLGIIAFTLAFKRLISRYDDGAISPQAYGVSVIMRYTLRLLTIQQFQRAAVLMCACEYERRHDIDTWGELQFNVGLWVGRKTTPNYLLKDSDPYGSAESTLNAWRRSTNPDYRPKEHNPVQLLSCPWCGSDLGNRDYSVDVDAKYYLPKKCRVFCPNQHCFFHKSHMKIKQKDKETTETCIPILVVDEDIYKWCPSLLISTIDKFAQISWRENIGSLFGKTDSYCTKCGFYNSITTSHPKHRDSEWDSFEFAEYGVKMNTPELIVQDELHLISGPMGTLTALYETAINYFCKRSDGIYPKIISSTATTRAASEQIRSLFNNEQTRIFPPQGIQFGETFFSTIDKRAAGKIFVGLCPTGRSNLGLQTRITAALLRTTRRLYEKSEPNDKVLHSAIDPYYTLVSYFNSMRELGGAGSSYKDTVPDLIQAYYDRVEVKQEEMTKAEAEKSKKKEESQEKSETVSTGLAELLDEDEIEQEKEAENAVKTAQLDKRKQKVWKNRNLNTEELTGRQDSGNIPKILQQVETKLGDSDEPIDMLLSTNMLSVGVDIQRLGLMMINGQPKNHSEYIQAAGRIGRRAPGLIITLYNPLKPRDLSHYENFKYYHSTFFKNVEPISLTPFAKRARDAGLFGVLVGLIRNLVPIMASNTSAKRMRLNNTQIKNQIDEIKNEFSTRVGIIDPPELQSTLDHIDSLFKLWEKYAIREETPLLYKTTQYTKKAEKQNYNYLLKSIERGEHGLSEIPATPMSLREAEQEQQLYYYNGDDSDVPE